MSELEWKIDTYQLEWLQVTDTLRLMLHYDMDLYCNRIPKEDAKHELYFGYWDDEVKCWEGETILISNDYHLLKSKAEKIYQIIKE